MKTIISIFFIMCAEISFAQNCNYTDVSDINVNNNFTMAENSIFCDPNNNNIVLNANNAFTKIGAFVSTNGGQSWQGGVLLPNEIDKPSCDPAVSIDNTGRLYIGYLSTNYRQYVAWSTNLGVNWNPVMLINNPTDKNHLWSDNYCYSPFFGRIYSAWTNTQVWGHQISFTTNQGLNWAAPVNIYTSSTPRVGVNITTDKHGYVYVSWSKSGGGNNINNYSIAISSNGGFEWNVIENFVPNVNSDVAYGYSGVLCSNIFKDRIFFVYSNISLTETGSKDPDYNIYLVYSDNKGINWNGPIQVNQNALGIQRYPWIACDQKTGILSCIYYDNRENQNISFGNAFVSISTDNGMNWCDMKVGDNGGYYTGGGVANDYICIAINNGRILPCWSIQNNQNQSRTFVSPINLINSDLIIYPPVSENYYYSSNSISTSGDFQNQIFTSEFISGNYIDLLPGFASNEGSDFTAIVNHCGSGDNFYISDNGHLKLNNLEKINNSEILSHYHLFQNYPNPFNPETNIYFNLKQENNVKLVVYDVLGKEIKTLINQMETKGLHKVIWDGKDEFGLEVASGIYFYKLIVSDYIDIKKMVLIR